jgi:hypothetical protein
MPRKQSTMSPEHKKALAQGREQSRVVKEYLEALEATAPRRGRRRTPESIQKRLAVIEDTIDSASAIQRLQLLQERRDLEAELDALDEPIDIAGLEKAFIKVAAAYGDAKGITWPTWREAGVTPEVLTRAGIARTRS